MIERSQANLTVAVPLIQESISKVGVPTRYVGGLPTDLLLHESAEIDLVERSVRVADTAEVSLYRNNGTVRDIDLLCLTDEPGATARLSEVIDCKLAQEVSPAIRPEISVSGYENEVKKGALLQVLSQVSKNDEGVHLSVGKIDEIIDPVTFEEEWHIAHEENKLSIFHPIAHAQNYRIRSIAGLRPKDRDKVSQLESSLLTEFSPGEWDRFAAFQRLESRLETEMTVRNALLERDTQIGILALAKKVVGFLESQEVLIKHTQKEGSFVHKLASFAVKKSRKSFQ